MTNHKKYTLVFTYIFCLALVIVSLFPFLQMLSISFKNQVEWGSPNLIPKVINTSAYKKILQNKSEIDMETVPANVKKLLQNDTFSEEQRKKLLEKYSKGNSFNFLLFMKNSTIFAILSSLISLIVSILGAYAIARLKFAGQKILQRSILFIYLIGGVVIMVPLYQLATNLGLTQTKVGTAFTILLIYILQTLPLAVYMLANYLRSIPYSLEEAAQIDGCSKLGIIIRIIIPISKPILASLCLLFYYRLE